MLAGQSALTVDEAAARRHVAVLSIWRAITRGRLRAWRLRGAIVVDRDEVDSIDFRRFALRRRDRAAGRG